MNSRGLKVFLACAFGAFIGALLALRWEETLGKFAPWVGFFSGGLVGYLSYEIRSVIKAVRTLGEGFFDKERLKVISVGILGGLSVGSTVGLILGFGVVLVNGSTDVVVDSSYPNPVHLSLFMCSVFCVLLMVVAVDDEYNKSEKDCFEAYNIAKTCIKLNPISVCLWYLPVLSFFAVLFLCMAILYACQEILITCIRRVPVWICRFIRMLFIRTFG